MLERDIVSFGLGAFLSAVIYLMFASGLTFLSPKYSNPTFKPVWKYIGTIWSIAVLISFLPFLGSEVPLDISDLSQKVGAVWAIAIGGSVSFTIYLLEQARQEANSQIEKLSASHANTNLATVFLTRITLEIDEIHSITRDKFLKANSQLNHANLDQHLQEYFDKSSKGQYNSFMSNKIQAAHRRVPEFEPRKPLSELKPLFDHMAKVGEAISKSFPADRQVAILYVELYIWLIQLSRYGEGKTLVQQWRFREGQFKSTNDTAFRLQQMLSSKLDELSNKLAEYGVEARQSEQNATDPNIIAATTNQPVSL